MSDNISPIGDAVRRLTYAELAAVRGISVPSARRLSYDRAGPDMSVTTLALSECLSQPQRRKVAHERTRADRAELRIAEFMAPWWRRWFRW